MQKLFDTFRGQMRGQALKQWKPYEFCERVIDLVEFDAHQSLDDGWRMLRCESYIGYQWIALCGWGGPSRATPPTLPLWTQSVAARGVKRGRETVSASANSSSSSSGRSSINSNNKHNLIDSKGATCKWVSIGGEEYTTLPLFLGKTHTKSQKSVVTKCAAGSQVELRQGDWKTLVQFLWEEILAAAGFKGYRAHRWVNSVGKLQVRLLPRSQQPSSKMFLWSRAELEMRRALLIKAH